MSNSTGTGSVPDVRPRTFASSGPHVDTVQVPRTDVRKSSARRHGLDAELHTAVRHAALLRRGFYSVVLVVALAGQVSGAVHALDIPLLAAVPAVGALELGGVVVMANADVRRRLGEGATGSRLLSAAVAAGAVAFNWTAHPDPLLGGFFAGMSALGYLVWLTHTENSRRDRLRALEALPPTTPAYEPVGHWIRHPWLTHRAKSLAKAHPNLGLYESLDAARAELDTERRRKAIAAVLHRKIRAAVDPTTADIAVAVYDLDEIAVRLANRADYDELTDLIAEDLAPTRLASSPTQTHQPTTAQAPTFTGRTFGSASLGTRSRQLVVSPTLATHQHLGDGAALLQSTAASAQSAVSTGDLELLPHGGVGDQRRRRRDGDETVRPDSSRRWRCRWTSQMPLPTWMSP
ncbi:hypothetical protein [Dactylosporangium cerinum]